MIIGGQLFAPKDARWASIHQYRGFRGASFYGEPLANKTWFCAENTSSCPECYSCCASSNFKRGSKGYKACIRRCNRKFPQGQCTGTNGGGGVPAPDAPPGAEQCPVVCVPDGTGVTCNYNCMGVSMNIINTDVPGEVIPLQKAQSLFNRQAWETGRSAAQSGWASTLPYGAGTYVPPSEEGGGIVDTITSNLPMIALVGGGLFLATRFLKK